MTDSCFARLAELKRAHTPIVMVTAYDIVSARVAEAAGVDITLVGDSGANVVLGYESTREVSVDELIMLGKAVRRGLHTPMLVCDLPFGSYEESNAQAVATARRFRDAVGCEAVKIEGGGVIAERARAVIDAGIPVMGHVGLLPQHLEPGTPPRARGRGVDEALGIARSARELQSAGCFSLVFEAVPAAVATAIAATLTVPTIGIGAGGDTDGQVLVFHDLMGLSQGRTARFAKRYAELFDPMVHAMRAFADDVRARRYPAAEHTYPVDPDQLQAFLARLSDAR
ncbi:MAG: 3-methyl-2-oxobutanoate hydroxymethyltransferase [Gemmatimonadaceae bacterium]